MPGPKALSPSILNGRRSMKPSGCTVSRWLKIRMPGASWPQDERIRRRFDFDPAADAVKDGPGVKGIGRGQHHGALREDELAYEIGQISRPLKSKRRAFSGLLGHVVSRDLLDQIDNAAPQPGIGDASEGAGQRQPFGSREEVEPFAKPLGGAARPAFEQ